MSDLLCSTQFFIRKCNFYLVEIKVQQRWVRFNTLVRSGQPLKPMMLMLFGCMLSYLGPQVYALICSCLPFKQHASSTA